MSAANIKAIKDAITAAKLASSTATVNDGDKVKFSGIGASGDTKYDNLKLTVAAAYKGTMEVVLTVDVDATKQIIFKMPVTVHSHIHEIPIKNAFLFLPRLERVELQ